MSSMEHTVSKTNIYKEMSNNRVVITGLGVIAPNGIGIDEFWNNTLSLKSGIKKMYWDKKFEFSSNVFGVINDNYLDYLKILSNLDVKDSDLTYIKNNKFAVFTIYTIMSALIDSGVEIKNLQHIRSGISFASAIAGATNMEQILLKLSSSNYKFGNFTLKDFDYSSAISILGKYLRINGSLEITSTGCTAGVDALGLAFNKIRYKENDLVITGASDAPLCPLSIGAFESIGALSTIEDVDPTRISRPFTANRAGFVLAEGAGAMVLENYSSAITRNSKIYAEVVGYASNNNTFHMTNLPASGEDLAECIELALSDAGCKATDINYISAHGSSTQQNDINETNAIKKVFGDYAYKIPINSLKAINGHALSAANAIEMVATCLCIKNSKVYGTKNYIKNDPKCDLDYIEELSRDHKINYALKVSSGFSGIHSVAIFKSI